MRRTPLLLAPLLLSSGAFATTFGCAEQTDPKARLACYDQIASAISQCQAQQDQLDRLLCFDSITQVSGTPDSTPKAQSIQPEPDPAAPAAVAVAPVAPVSPAPQASPQTEFGFEAQAVDHTPDAISARVAEVSTDPYGKWTVTLDNGQRWRQTESKRFRLKADQEVVISKGSLGSFMLKREGSNSSTRVKRVQ
ncbi:hypothetical protein [Ferrimonas marina]|uniref:Uncharacterized protein n=1 Tax=Ferrimonas marina TaxID=299255 RepID=A0A1M5XY12_9GAMM|nr:hypothetical protein [Ferrimonas marina]SHI04438.1 hypothetical protein SAMN02745129_3779 [Ferrimonas marina]